MPPNPKKRGVLYVVWNKSKHKNLDGFLRRSMQSVFKHHPELGIKVHECPDGASLLDKSKMYEWSPFEETLYLDVDTVVMGKLDYGFEQAMRHELALSICEAPYARRYTGMIKGDVIEYNTGVMFFRKGPVVERLFGEWSRLAFSEDSSHLYVNAAKQVMRQISNDQAAFAKAVDGLRLNPFVLPCNWNFRSAYYKNFFGPLKVWHDYSDPPRELVQSQDSMPADAILCFGAVP